VQEGLADENLPLVGQWNGHWLNALVQLFYKRNYEQALEEAKITVGIVPNDSETLAHVALVAIYAGDSDLALEWINRAISREPHVPGWYYLHRGLAYHRKGNCDRAFQEFEKVPWPAYDKEAASATCYVERGQLDKAQAELAELHDNHPGFTTASLRLRLPYKDNEFSEQYFATLAKAGLQK
ncbi:MAG: tetratricopeptide repeat protein, partial [Alphaproteobacteria bacterium]